jgi:hypothetical protein
MMQNNTMLDMLERAQSRKMERRRFLTTIGAATTATAGLALLSACDDDKNDAPAPTPTPTPTSTQAAQDLAVLNFALNLEYLEATFYAYAAFGAGLAPSNINGVGSPGSVTGGRQVNFQDPLVAQYAREIAADEVAHVTFLRKTLSSAAVALPALNIDGGASGAFTAAARAAGLVPSTGTFDPYASDENFLLAAFIFEDVGVTAYKGAAKLISNKAYLEAAAGIAAAEAYHAGLVRTVLYRKGMDTASLLTSADAISNARDSLDGSTDLDQGISGTATASNIVPTDSDGIAYSRSAAQVLNIVYLNPAAVSSGGFFPSGVNGSIKTSGANSAG